jgi:O-antigen/teichoic acid export membrane protein
LTHPALRSRVTRGLAWKATSSGTLQLMKIAVGVVLARLLTPHDYGLAGMVIVFSTLVLVFSDLAFGAALIYRKRLSEDDRSTVFWTSVAVGAALTLVGVALAKPLADFYGEPEVQPLFAVMSVTFVITALSSTQIALLSREMNFRTLELRKIGGALASGATGIGLAAAGFGAWAIIGQQIALAATSTILLWLAFPWRPRFRFSVKSLRSLGGYSANVFGSRLLFYANRNADNLLIGRFLGPAALGAYAVAYNVMLLPISQISIPVQDVLFPAFSRLQDDVEAIRTAWLRVNRAIASLTMPALLGLIAVAPDFVHVVLGDQWSSATRVIQILAWVGLLQSLQGLNSSILRAVDRTKTLFRYSVIVLVASLIAFVAGLHWGIIGVATAYAISSTIVEPVYTWMTARSVGLSLWGFARPLAGVAQASVVMFVAVVGARYALTQAGVSAGVRLILLIGIGAAVYIPFCAWRAPDVTEEIRLLRRRRGPQVAVEPT